MTTPTLVILPTPPTPRLTFLGPGAAAAELVRATAANHRDMFVRGALGSGGRVHHEYGMTWTHSPLDGHITIAFPRLPSRTAGTTLDMLLADCRRHAPREIACWSLTPAYPRDLGARLAARGFEWGWRPHWMALDLSRMRADFPVPAGLRITVEAGEPDWDVDDLPYYSRPRRDQGADGQATPTWRGQRRDWRFGAWLNGKIVGHSGVHLTTGRLGVAGIYDVGVVPAARNQGIGRAVSLAACQFAQALGCHWATLNSATHIYERLGFVSLGWGQTWFMHSPALTAPPPTPEEVAFAEAVGRGDITALNTLDRQGLLPKDLDTPLTGRHSPMTLAAQAGRPASAEWLAAHGATLEIIQAWDLDWRDRVPQLLAASPELADRCSGDWQMTPLHEAVSRDDLELARLLLAASPDLEIKDTQFHGTPLGWARHFGHTEMIRLLERHQAANF